MTARLRERSDFGRPCVDGADCDEGSLCLDAACVSQRESGAAGEGPSGTFFLVVDATTRSPHAHVAHRPC